MILKAGQLVVPRNNYPTSDGKPMAETDDHRKLMTALIETLEEWFRADPDTYVSGNLLLFYEKRNKRRHVSPDVFVVKGVHKETRQNYLVWEEKKNPEFVIELTSKTTKAEDTVTKRDLYERVLKVKEYFLFDPFEDYLAPSFQGLRRVRGKFQRVAAVDDRLPSEVLGLHLERRGAELRFWDPGAKALLPTTTERLDAERTRADAEAEQNRQLRREVAELRRRLGGG